MTRDGVEPFDADADVARVLQQRARALARPVVGSEVDGDTLEVLELRLGAERYGIESRHVREVCTLRHLTPLPCTPPFVAGVVGVRGRITAVLDLKQLLGRPPQGVEDLHCVVLVGNETLEFGFLADHRIAVRRVARRKLLAPMSTLGGRAIEYLQSVSDDHLMLLDMERIFADRRILVDDGPYPATA